MTLPCSHTPENRQFLVARPRYFICTTSLTVSLLLQLHLDIQTRGVKVRTADSDYSMAHTQSAQWVLKYVSTISEDPDLTAPDTQVDMGLHSSHMA